MGRRLPSSPYDHNTSTHPVLALSLLAISIAASISILATLCASCHRKSSPEKRRHAKAPPSSPPPLTGSLHKEKAETAAATAVEVAENEHEQQKPERPPTSDGKKVVVLGVSATHGPILPAVRTTERNVKRRLSMSLSMKIPDGLSKIRSKKEKNGKGAAEETIWKKTIILGEKCRVPSEDSEEGSVAGGGERGSQTRNYHPRTPRSLPVSRACSFSNADVLPL